MRAGWRREIQPEGGTSQPVRVLLVSLECTESTAQTPMLAPAYLTAQARLDPELRSRVEFHIRQYCVEEPIESIIEDLLDHPYDLMGFSCYVWNESAFRQIIPVVKRLRPNTLTVMGGPQTLGREREMLESLPELDMVVARDGELPFVDVLCRLVGGGRDWGSVGGIVFRSGAQVCDTLAQHRACRFEQIASPYIEGVIVGQHHNVYMETYRGCPYTCAFCAWGGDDVPKNDLLPLDRIRREIEIIAGMGAYSIGFFDANFNQPPPRAKAIFDILLANENFTVFGMSVFAQTLTEELAAAMGRRKAMMGVGLQSSSPEVNSLMRRRFRDEKMVAGLHLLNKYKLDYALQLIVGLPGDTYESIANSLLFALSFEPPTIDAFRLMVLPGTEYRRRASEFELVYEPHPYHYVVSHQTMGPAEINRAERMAQALNVFYNLPETRVELRRQVAESGENIIQYCDAIGTFIHNFRLLSRDELRKGNILRTHDADSLLKLMREFRHFRAKLSLELAEEEVRRELQRPERSTAPYGFVASN